MASSSQSRADVAAICVAAVLGLTGLQWLSLKPKSPKVVELDGSPVHYISESVQDSTNEILGYAVVYLCACTAGHVVSFIVEYLCKRFISSHIVPLDYGMP